MSSIGSCGISEETWAKISKAGNLIQLVRAMMIMSGYLAQAYFAAANAKSPEEYEKHKAEFEKRKAWYREQKLSMECEPDGSYHDIDDGTIWWGEGNPKRGPELWPEGWKPRDEEPTKRQSS